MLRACAKFMSRTVGPAEDFADLGFRVQDFGVRGLGLGGIGFRGFRIFWRAICAVLPFDHCEGYTLLYFG